MLKWIKKFLHLLRPIFIPINDDPPHDTFKSSLNYEAGRIYYVALISIFLWSAFIPFYIMLHPFPVLSIITIGGFSLTSLIIVLMRLNIMPWIKVDYVRPFQVFLSYLILAMALLTGMAGENRTVFMVAYAFALMTPIYTPFSLRYKACIMGIAHIIFTISLIATGFDFTNTVDLLSFLILLAVFGCSIIFSYSLNDLRRRTWQQQRKLAEMMIEVESKARIEAEMVAAKQASKSKSDFLAKMSHEIRTPMNAIMGMTELALRENLPKAAKEYMFTVIQASQYLLSIINDILDISKIESGRIDLLQEEYSLSSVICDTVNIARTKVYDTRLRFTVFVDSHMPNVLLGDAAKIRQIMLNLLSNAVKFTEIGFVSLSISSQITGEDEILLIIEVADSGRGIRQSDIRKLFKEFSQLDDHKSFEIEGSGLGLAITRTFVNSMGGSIDVSSEHGVGSTFTVKIPQKVMQKQALADILDRGSHSVLVFECRQVCKDSIRKSMINLGVNYELVSKSAEFYNKVMNGDFTHILVTPALFESVKDEYPDIKSDANIALMTEFGEITMYQDMSTIAAPVFCIPVANFINGVVNKPVNTFDRMEKAAFTAPTARVLVVDDLKTNLVVTEGLLRPYNMQIDLCKGGAESIVAVTSNHYDLVLMDHMMPVMDGMDATARIRALDRDGSGYFENLPIVAMTANAVSGMMEMFLSNGFNDFLSKPVDTIALDNILERWIPDEKKEKPSNDSSRDIKVNLKPDVSLVIEGLDVSKGITLTGGTPEKYIRVLEEFHKESMEKIKEIKQCLEAEDLYLFTIYIHAIKNGCHISGADALSKVAGDLESAGSNNDLDYIRENVEVFLSSFETLLDNICWALSQDDSKEKKEYVDVKTLRRYLEKYKTALIEHDGRTLREIGGVLENIKHNDEIDQILSNILYKRLIGDYKETLSLTIECLKFIS